MSTPPTITGTIAPDPVLEVTPGDVREWGGTADDPLGRALSRSLAVSERERARADAAEHERDAARARVERLTADLDARLGTPCEQIRHEQTIDAIRDALGVREDETIVEAAERVRGEAAYERVHEHRADAAIASARAQRDAALERCGYYERGHVPRLLGIAPDQLATVRAVLAAAQRWSDAGDRVLRRTEVALVEAVTAWIAAGRPLAGEEMRDADRRGE